MINKNELNKKVSLLKESLQEILYDRDEFFIENMKKLGKDVSKYVLWEWPQGVGVYGLYKCYLQTKDEKYLDTMESWLEDRLKDGLPGKNVNTVIPLLSMACLHEIRPKEEYKIVMTEWSEWIMNKMPRTEGGGLQHTTSDSENPGELWDDTLFMTVLFLAKTGVIFNKQEYIDESIRQFLLHTKYLSDPKTGLWYHGWTFEGGHHFAGALWGRGNSWITIGIPEFIEMVGLEGAAKTFLIETFKRQVDALAKYQHESGMWHTLINDSSSYLESSATAGFTYGILKGVREGYLEKSYLEVGLKGLKAVLDNIREDGEVKQVSYGTAMGHNLEFYKEIPLQRMAYGQSMAMLALVEGQHNL